MYKRQFNNFPFEYHQPLEVTVESLTNLGDGVARVPITAEDGEQRDWVLFIPYALTGERLKVRVVKNGAKSSHTEIIDILEPSPHRVEPKCKVYNLCGGCQYQHISYEQQLVEKRTHVAELLQRLGGVTHEVNAPLASPTAWGYRSKITPHLSLIHI